MKIENKTEYIFEKSKNIASDAKITFATYLNK